MSNNTNPYAGDFSEYPDVKQDNLKNLYLNTILSLNSLSYIKENLTSDNVLFTVGSMEGLDLILRTFAEPNQDTICVTSPSFSAYAHWALIHNLKVKTIPLFGDNLDQIATEDILLNLIQKLFFCVIPITPQEQACTRNHPKAM